MVGRFFGQLFSAKQAAIPQIRVKVRELDQLSADQRQAFAQFLNSTKQKSIAAAGDVKKEEILYANTPYQVSYTHSDGSLKSCSIVLDAHLVCYPRKKDEIDRRFAVIEESIGSGYFGSVYKSKFSLSVVNTADVMSVNLKSKKEEKLRVVKLQDYFILPDANDLLAEKECRLTRIAAPELKMKPLIRHASKRMTAMVMRYLPGDDLFDVLDRDELTNDIDRLQICLALAENLESIHANGVMHRDLKPENIRVIKGSDGRYQAAIVDFGLATEAANPDSNGCGSPYYAAPEMFQAPEVIRAIGLTFALDIYSLGRVFEAIFGCMASWPDNDRRAIFANFSTPFNNVFTKNHDTARRAFLIKNGLSNLFARMRERDRAKRIALADVIEQLRDLQAKLACFDNPHPSVVTVPSLFAASASLAAAAAAPQQTENEYGYDEEAFRHNCS